MRVRVKLFAGLGRFREGTSPGAPFEWELSEPATLQRLVESLRLPREDIKVTFVNGRARPLDWALAAGDEVGIFPAVGGG
jgi:molybdopterin converting factor small subunit